MKNEQYNQYVMIISGIRIEVTPRIDQRRIFATAKVNDFLYETEVKSFADYAWVAVDSYNDYLLYLRIK
jgi:hypothetical protein